MPQKKQQEQYENAMSSVFDFIFSTTQKPPSKVKPVKASGIDSSSEMVDAFTGVLENPLLFVNTETLGAFEDAIDINVAQFKLGGRAGSDTLKINLKDIGDIIRDPGAFVDAKFKTLEAIRKSQRATWAGEELKGVLGGVWAAQKGLDKETRLAMSGAGRISTGARSVGAEAGHMLAKTESLAEKYLDPSSPALQMSYFVKRYGRGARAKEAFDDYTKYRVAYTKSGRDFIYSQNLKEVSEIFTFLEGQELDQKSRNAMAAGDYKGAGDYEKASYFVEHAFDEQKEKFYRIKQKEVLKKYSQAIEKIKSGSGPNKKQKIKALEKERKKLQQNITSSRLETAAGTLGRLGGGWNSVKRYYEGDLLPDIITGRFFEDAYNQIRWLQPSEGKDFKFGGKEIKFHGGKGSDFAPKQLYNTGMNAVYYLSPVTWARSLMTGEIFAYAGHVQRELFKLTSKVGKIPGLNRDLLMKDLKEGTGYIKGLKSTLSKAQWRRLQFFVQSNKFIGGVAYFFNTPDRIKKAIQGKIDQYTVKLIREQIKKYLLKVIKDKTAAALIKDWAARGGVKTLIKGLVTSVASALGVATTGAGGVLISAVTWVATEVVYQIAKPLVKFTLEAGKLGFYSLLGLSFLFISMGTFFVGVFAPHSSVAPQDIIQCDAYEDLNLDQPDEEEEGNCPNCLTNIRINNTSYIPSKSTVTGIIDGWVQACPLGGYPEVCYEDVYCRALKYGIDPAFAFTIWSNESGGSNYANVPDVQDFGINLSAIEADFDAQIEHFLQKIAIPDYASGCSWQSIDTQGLDPTIIKWGTRFLTGACAGSSAAQLEMGRDYMLKISTIYNWYTNKTLSWPFTVPADSGACDYSSAQVNNVYNSCNQKAQGYCDGSGSGGSSGGEDINFESRPGEAVESLFNRMASEMGLSGAQLGLISPGHELYGDLDGGWWCWAYSMNQVYCKSDKVTSSNDYIVKLFKHELTHLRQYRNASGSYGSLFMEWGADWVSGNGGGYSFTTKNGTCIKATETPMLPGCSSEAYRGIAYNEESYLSSQCFGSLKSYITGFCGSP